MNECGCHGERDDSEGIEAAEARRRQGEGAVLVDVREHDEWAAGHAIGALNIPLDDLLLRLPDLPTDRDVLFICNSGNRSGVAAAIAERAGLPRAHNVRGGLNAWTAAGLPTQTGSASGRRRGA